MPTDGSHQLTGRNDLPRQTIQGGNIQVKSHHFSCTPRRSSAALRPIATEAWEPSSG